VNDMRTYLVTIFLSAAIFLANGALAANSDQHEKEKKTRSDVTSGAYLQAANNRAKQAEMFKDAYETGVARTLVGRRSPTFKDGREKTSQRLERDRQLADNVEKIAGHLTDKQAGDLVNMIAEYGAAQPDTELVDVIEGFLLTEAKK